MNPFAPYVKINGCFIVMNVSPQVKTIKIFQYPIPYQGIRDILAISGVAEGDIRASLLKGELQHKIRSNDIVILCSDIDLLQFNENHKAFLQSAGVVNGLSVSTSAGDLTSADHATLRQLIHFIDEGPGDGFASGAYKVVTGQPFPTSIIWYTSVAATHKLVEKTITYNSSQVPITIVWNMYNTDGVTVIHTVIDTITYVNGIFESNRSRVII